MSSSRIRVAVCPVRLHWVMSAVVLLGALCLPRAHASDAHEPPAKSGAAAKPTKESKSAAKAASDEHEKPTSEAPQAAAESKAGGARDPMEVIRERLAARLGSAKVPAEPTPGVVKVVSQQSMVEPVAAPRARAAAPRSAEAPAVMAAAGGTSRVIGASPQHAAKLEAAGQRAAAAGHGGEAAHWSYEGAGGPNAWGQLKPEFSTCSTGTRQSPIDITDGIKVELDAVQFDYRPSAFRVIDNGHTVQVNVAAGSTIEVGGRRYELVQFHFHRPSEERINGRPFDMVAHLVHKSVDGKLAVIAVLLSRGSAQPVVQQVWNNLPLEKGDEVAARTELDLNALLPTDRRYFTYMGSLTTPPCSEGVLWMVMKTPVEVSPDQIRIFSRLYPMNARPVQSAAGRLIKESN